MEGRERLLRQLISDIITELAAIEAQEVGTCVADDIRGIRRMLADGVTALGSDTTRNITEVAGACKKGCIGYCYCLQNAATTQDDKEPTK